LRTVAEGVEDTLQWHALADLGCDEVQGFLVSRPLEPDAVQALLADPRKLRSALQAFDTADID
jgi:EAL domain-containing protein (putative c-di-GMP-specific phosphodiesterase class I)